MKKKFNEMMIEIENLKSSNENLKNEIESKSSKSNHRMNFIERMKIDSKLKFSDDILISQFQNLNRDESFISISKILRNINNYQYHEILSILRLNYKISDSDIIDSMKKISHKKF